MRPIFNEKVAKKWDFWVRALFIGPTDVLKMVEKSNSAATVHEQCMNNSRTIFLIACQKKKEKENATLKTQRSKRCIQTSTK